MTLAFWAGFGVASFMWVFLMVWAWCAAAGDADEEMIRHAEWVDTPSWCCSRYADCRLCPNTYYHHPDAQRSEATN